MSETELFLRRIESALASEEGLRGVLGRTIEHFDADTGTIHQLGEDGLLHLEATGGGIPDAVMELIQTIPVGKGMAGLAVERSAPVTACNIQTDATGDVRPGAKATGLEGAICVVGIIRYWCGPIQLSLCRQGE